MAAVATTIFLLLLPQYAAGAGASPSFSSSDACDASSSPEPRTLIADKLTVLISGYSELRIPLLSSLAASYSSIPIVASVIVLWFNTSTPSSILSSELPPEITVLRHPTPSLNSRFLPRSAISTRAVAVADDDVEVDPRSLELAFAAWRSRSGRGIAGFFARSHELDLRRRSWIYTVHRERYSIVLTKLMILPTKYLRTYSCSPELAGARRVVEEARNCEDILMNFVAAMDTGEGPMLIGGRRVRDWGDPRNRGRNYSGGGGGGSLAAVGMSSREDHRRRRGECIGEFHRILGEMPLRYSYGKVVGEVGEQGLCSKEDGKLVFCDQQHS